jgi:cell division septation protein DedD
MDSKKKCKILGILMIIAFIIILLPFFQGDKDLPIQTVTIKEPPFPKPIAQVTVAEGSSQSDIPSASSMVKSKKIELGQRHDTTSATIANKSNVTTSDVILPSIAKTAQEKPVTNTLTSLHREKDKAALGSSSQTVRSLADRQKHVETLFTTAGSNELVKLKHAVWAIQLGNFRNKAHALQLVNSLRASGYHAFMQYASSMSGETMRVFIGPELNRSSARILANRIERGLHIRGIVVSYKPLDL